MGLLMGGAVFSFGHSCGCRKAEILAIKDDGELLHRLPDKWSLLQTYNCLVVCLKSSPYFLLMTQTLYGHFEEDSSSDKDSLLDHITPTEAKEEVNADAWHKRLVRYYSYFGFMPVREVGDSGLRDIPDLLVWGGVGQRMDANIKELLGRWTSAIRRSVPKGLN